MNLLEIKESKKIFDVIWTYNLWSSVQLDNEIWKKAEDVLCQLLEKLIPLQSVMTQEQVQEYFRQTVLDLENLLDKPLDEGIYEYGGLNSFFADIMESLDFPVKYGKYYLIGNFVYGQDFEEKPQ